MSITYSPKWAYILSFEMEICIIESYAVSRNIFAPLGMRGLLSSGKLDSSCAKGNV